MKKLYNQFKRLMLYGGLDRETYRELRPYVDEDNLTHLQFYTLFAVCLFAVIVWLYLAYYQDGEQNRFAVEIAYVTTGCIMAVITLISRDTKLASKGPWVGTVLRWIFYLTLYALTIYLSWLHPSDPGTSYVVAMVALPLLFSEAPACLTALTVGLDVFYLIMSFHEKILWAAYLDLWNVLIFGTISVVLSCGIARMRYRVFAQERRMHVLSETDVLTGTLNRNCFEESQMVHANNPAPRINYVYGDVNGLHELNNAKGHLAGDKMLKTVASALIAAFGQKNVYRMGGDEFLAFVPGATVKSVTKTVDGIEAHLEDAGYHVSFGIAQARRENDAPYDVAALVQTAEQRMYAIKRAYYSQKNHDRRRHEWSPVDHEINE